jgi:hypothetical protein
VLFGHQFSPYVSAQVSYTRPVKFVLYNDVNGTQTNHHVWMAFGDVSLRSRLPISARWSIAGEAGLAIVNRTGFAIGNAQVVNDAHFATALFGGGAEYRANARWDLLAGATYIPAHSSDNQPAITLGSLGFRYNMRSLPVERVEENRKAGFIFPENVIQVAFTTNTFGYGANNFVSSKVPIFWGGHVQVARGATLRYQRNIFHTRKLFALDLGASVSSWRSDRDRDSFWTISGYPLLRFTVVRTKPADLFVCYSVAGPTYISKRLIDGLEIGNHFTFQDLLGVGAFIGSGRKMLVEVNIGHYSNGNLAARNPGTKIPLSFNLGYGF